MDTSIYSAMLHQMLSGPAAVMTIIGLSVLAYVFEVWPSFNSRMIPVVITLLGPCTYWLFAGKGTVPESYPYPAAVLIVNGLVSGLAATNWHGWITCFIMQKAREKREKRDRETAVLTRYGKRERGEGRPGGTGAAGRGELGVKKDE